MTDVIELDGQLRQLADDLNRALIEQLVSKGRLTAAEWRAAFAAAPRHLFAPRFTMPDNMGGGTIDGSESTQREQWLRAVYHDDALLTDFDEQHIPTSSCSAPSVVATMLESSRATEGDSVLEIGTGTGWTAGLFARRLGPDAVTSVDISPTCVSQARERLNRLGLAPSLAVADGYLGYEPRAPFDRMIATASLRKVPPAWLSQVRPGGTILVDLRGSYAGNLALLTVTADQSAHGRFLPETVSFMPLRSVEHPFHLDLSGDAVTASGQHRITSLDPSTLRERAFAFFAQVAMPGTQTGHMRVKGGPMYFCVTDSNSHAWARVETDTGADRPVVQGADRRLWDELEAAHELWHDLRQPRPEDFTIMIMRDGRQVVSLPGSDHVWTLPL